ncbi:hypothetical protein FE697_015595 [Mumia zhuanghuii]|uniref:Uncharacterized protein n=2 Tax=Mumia TaxID=1546255 RepID=A0ABW1QPR6_9ACTN|nr:MULTISPECIES: hypothetical protein [Mumia]KAA1420390.1 hypothetical protein FE697_015595 [Mumia zhuanghuii]
MPDTDLTPRRSRLVITLAVAVATVVALTAAVVGSVLVGAAASWVRDPAGDGVNVDAPMSYDSVTTLWNSLQEDPWWCYEPVATEVVRCHWLVPGDVPERATLRIDMADGGERVARVTLDAGEAPADVREAAARQVGNALLDNQGDTVAAAVVAGRSLGVAELGVPVHIEPTEDGFELRDPAYEGLHHDAPAPPSAAKVTETLREREFACDPDGADCRKSDGYVEFRVVTDGEGASARWTVQARERDGFGNDPSELTTELSGILLVLGLVDDEGFSFVESAEDGEVGDLAGVRLEVGLDPGTAEVLPVASVTAIPLR